MSDGSLPLEAFPFLAVGPVSHCESHRNQHTRCTCGTFWGVCPLVDRQALPDRLMLQLELLSERGVAPISKVFHRARMSSMCPRACTDLYRDRAQLRQFLEIAKCKKQVHCADRMGISPAM